MTEQDIDDWLMEPSAEEHRQLKRQHEAIVLQCEQEMRDIDKKIAFIRAESVENKKKLVKCKQMIHTLIAR